MKVAIIGAGNVGTALAGTATRAGHEVVIAAAHPDHAAAAAAKVGATPAASAREAATGADVVVLAVPVQAVAEVAREVAAARPSVIVDVTNRPTPDPEGHATSIAEEVQAAVPGARVVKAFNTAFASVQADPAAYGVPVDGFVAGDDAQAKQTALAFVESLGFRPVDAGSLAAARTLEGMAWLNISRNLQGGSWQDAWVLLGPDESN
ncbi:MAG TPA: prephenate dehydrogenase/arogenate dehydrogenase family protein [Candidatus Limnocylindrales bacterium]|nr:prephenate dehydrogenase/arogenate dehydrogenase family protein [Candidatus Limnocylindrales bacterium]